MRVLVTGGRDFTSHGQRMWLYAGLSMLDELSGGILEIIEGGAQGADLAARNWALWRKACDRLKILKITTVPAEWAKYGKAAGAMRNAQMAAMRPDVVLACPGGRGTADMVSKAKAAGLKVIFLEKMPVARG